MKILSLVAVVVVVAAGCQSRDTPLELNDSSAIALVGSWDVTLSLERSYELEPVPPRRTAIHGTMAFVGPGATLNRSVDRYAPAQPGVYDLALTEIGLAWGYDDRFPEAAGTISGLSNRSHSDGDSVFILLNPQSQERIVLAGRYASDMIVGKWSAQSARGFASGSFFMRRQSPAGAVPDRKGT